MRTIRKVTLEVIDDSLFSQKEWPSDFRRFRLSFDFSDGRVVNAEEMLYISDFCSRTDCYLEIMARAIKMLVENEDRFEAEKREQAKKDPS